MKFPVYEHRTILYYIVLIIFAVAILITWEPARTDILEKSLPSLDKVVDIEPINSVRIRERQFNLRYPITVDQVLRSRLTKKPLPLLKGSGSKVRERQELQEPQQHQ